MNEKEAEEDDEDDEDKGDDEVRDQLFALRCEERKKE